MPQPLSLLPALPAVGAKGVATYGRPHLLLPAARASCLVLRHIRMHGCTHPTSLELTRGLTLARLRRPVAAVLGSCFTMLHRTR